MPNPDAASLVLVVEDDPVLSGIYRSALEMSGFRTEPASDGSEALEKIAGSQPALVILDIGIPTIDGWGVLDRLQQTAGCPPVVVVSSFADLERAKRLGARACFSKPFRLAELCRTCEELLRPPGVGAGASRPRERSSRPRSDS